MTHQFAIVARCGCPKVVWAMQTDRPAFEAWWMREGVYRFQTALMRGTVERVQRGLRCAEHREGEQ